MKVKREGTKLSAPGIGDDCRGLATTLAAVRQIINNKIPFAGRLLVVATVGEEGPGNLRGVRAIFASPLKDSLDGFISVDGTGFGITNGGVGSNRYRVSYVGPGGHSYGAFGMPNPIHALGRAIAKISDLQASAQPKVTFNVGIISGGTSVNSIADKGVMEIDLRSESGAALAAIDAKLQVALRDALREERARWPQSKVALDMKIDTIGLRPAGMTPDTSFIVVTAQAAANVMNIYAPLSASSTDANEPMGRGVPAITLDGGGVGRGAHSLDEWYDDRTDGYKGPQWVLLVVLGPLGGSLDASEKVQPPRGRRAALAPRQVPRDRLPRRSVPQHWRRRRVGLEWRYQNWLYSTSHHPHAQSADDARPAAVPFGQAVLQGAVADRCLPAGPRRESPRRSDAPCRQRSRQTGRSNCRDGRARADRRIALRDPEHARRVEDR